MKTLNTSFKSFLPPLICALIFGLASWLIFYLTDPGPDKIAAQRLEKLNTLQKQDQNHLESYGWVDKAKDVVQIPIERAMELEQQTLSSLTPHAAESPTLAD